MHLFMKYLLCTITAIALKVNGYFHEPSVRIISPPNTLRNQSLFGYSIAYQKEDRQLMISAPRADNVGKIFSTNLDTGIITLMPFDIKHDTGYENDFWLGAIIKANSTNFMTCAPRSTNYYAYLGARCFYGTSPNRIYSLPASDFSDSMHSYGWSMDLDTNLYVGSPVFIGNAMVLAKDSSVQGEENFYIQNAIFDYSNITETYNFAYSMVNGKFFSDYVSLALSSTYGEYGQGKIYFYEDNLEVWSISDGGVGSMYGATLAVANLGPPLLSSLLVGAPTHTDKAHNYDVGAVYLYIPDRHSKILKLQRVISGETDGGYFGAAIVSVGDMDGDELDEVAIAAPYEDSGKGAVYIYTGAGLLRDHTWAQKIHAPEDLRTFGMSLTALNEFTSNGCDGLAISAPDSNRVAVYKGVPLITVVLSTNYSSLQGRKNLDFFEIESRLDVNPLGLGKIEAEISVKIEIMHPNAKLANADADGTFTYNVSFVSTPSKNSTAIKVLTPNNGDYEQVISYRVTARLIESPDSDFKLSRVMLSDRSVLLSLGSVWAADCGTMECNPHLIPTFTTSIPKNYIPGASDNETISISLRNEGETAYSPCVRLHVGTARILRPSSGCVRADELLTCKPKTLLHTGDIWNIGDIYLETTSLTSADKYIQVHYDVYSHCNKEQNSHYEEIFTLQAVSEGIIVQGTSNTEEVVNITSQDIEMGKRIQHIYTISNLGPTNWVSVQCEVIVPRRKYLEVPENEIKINTELSATTCRVTARNETDGDIKAVCDIGDLRRNKATKIFLSISVVPMGLKNVIEKEDVILTTKINLLLDEPKSYSITNTLHYNCGSVSLWIILLAILFALLVLIIIVVVLYKRGFLQRKEKQRLVDLKKSIKERNSQLESNETASLSEHEQHDECDDEQIWQKHSDL